jgi:hypothetical protein
MDRDTTNLLRNLINKSSRDNNGQLIHKYISKQTDKLNDLSTLVEVFELVADVSLFACCREFIILKSIVDENESLMSSLAEQLDEISHNIIDKIAQKAIESQNMETKNEALLAFYCSNNENACRSFLEKCGSPQRFFFCVFGMCFQDKDLSRELFDIILFMINAVKCFEDNDINRCIRSIKLNPENAAEFLDNKYNDLCLLAKFFHHEKKYMALDAMLRMLETGSSQDMCWRRKAYEFIGIDEAEFLSVTYDCGSAKALNFYFITKFGDVFPKFEDVEHILNLKTTSSVYCVVLNALKRIYKCGCMDENIKNLFSTLKSKLLNGELTYNVIDEIEDSGIETDRINYYCVKIFQMLCKNEEDVSEFLYCISYFNIFSNGELRLDYRYTKMSEIRYADWKAEYKYISKRYNSETKTIAYIVANSYLRFYIDLFDLYKKCPGELANFWFPGYILNNGKITLFEETVNSDLKKDSYKVVKDDEQFNKKYKPEEIQPARFKISAINYEKRIISVKPIETLSNSITNLIYMTVHKLLSKEDIKQAYLFIKSFEKTGRNLYSYDRFIAVGKYLEERIDDAITLFEKQIEQTDMIRYIYLNSFLRGNLPIEKMFCFFDNNEYLLGNINLEDNPEYSNAEYYYVRPNYYNPNGFVFKIKRNIISEALDMYIQGQLKWFSGKEDNKQDGGNSNSSVRICFRSLWDSDGVEKGEIELNSMYLHCCETKIDSLANAFQICYKKIYKPYRKGITSNTLKRYIACYKDILIKNQKWDDNEWKEFVHLYLYILHVDLTGVIDDYSKADRWLYKDKSGRSSYNFLNPFVLTFDELFVTDIMQDNDEMIKTIKDDAYFSVVCQDLKSCKVMREHVYEKTIMNYLFQSLDDFLSNFEN